MTDNEIIKALECCSNQLDCVGCECVGNCPQDINELNGLALDLITRQKGEIERLKAELKEDYQAMKKALAVLDELKQEIANDIQTAKAEAVKEFAKYLIDRAEQSEISVGDIPDLVVDFQNRTQEDASIGSQPEWKQAMLRTFLGRGL